MTLDSLNRLPPDEARQALLRCCGSSRWAEAMAGARPFADAESLQSRADAEWKTLGEKDWREAFSHHPRIGAKVGAGDAKAAPSAAWARQEQSGVKGAAEETLAELARLNEAYYERFGYVFLVCATGKSADEMLALLKQRIHNKAADEIRVAAGEQGKITRIRLEKLLQ